MSKKNSLLSFVNIVNIMVEPWTNNRIKEYEALFSQLKTNREKVAVMLLSIFFQIPKISIKSAKILSEKCHVSINEVPNSLPQIVYNCLFRLLPVLSVKKDMTYTKVALICASSLPPSQLHFLFEVFLKYPEFHLAQSVYSVLFERDPTLSNYFSENFDKCESILPYAFSSLNLQPFPNEFILKIASLFLSGKVQTTSPFFYSFCFYINRNIFPIDFETTDYFVLTLFQKIEHFYVPHSHSYLFQLISEKLNDYPLPFISIHLFFQDFDENQIKSIFTTLIKENGSIKSFFVLSQIVASDKMKELYSIATCTRFCTYTAMKKNIYFFKRSLEKITSLHFELRVLSKILEIASLPEFQDISFEFLDIFKPFTATANAMSDILKIFFTRDKKLISGLISKNVDTKASILTALYLLGNSPIGANPKFKTRYKSLAKAIIPRLSINGLQINCLMPKSLSTTLTKKNLSNDELVTFYYNLTVKQIKPAPFKVENAINIISLFQLNRDELGYTIRENPEVPPNSFDDIKTVQSTEKNNNNQNFTITEMSIFDDDDENENQNENQNKTDSNIKSNQNKTNSNIKLNQNKVDSNIKLNQNKADSNIKLNKNESKNKSNIKLNKSGTGSNFKLKPKINSKTNLNKNISRFKSVEINDSKTNLNKNISNIKSSEINDTKAKKKKDVKKVISSSVDLNIEKPENRSLLSETVAVVDPIEKVHDYQIELSVVENIDEKKHEMVIESSVIDDVEEKQTKLMVQSSVAIDNVDEKEQKMVIQSSVVDDVEEKNHSFVLESTDVDDIEEKVHKMVLHSSIISSFSPSLIKGKEKVKKLVFSSPQIFNVDLISNENDQKTIKFEIQSYEITTREPLKTDVSKKQIKLVLQSSVVSNIQPIIVKDDQKAFNFSTQNFVVSSIQPSSKDKKSLQLETSQSISRASQNKTDKMVSSTIVSIQPTKTEAQIEMEKLQKIPISKYNISTQVSLDNNQKKAELIISENSIHTEKVSSTKVNSICSNSDNNFETNLLSDDNLSSSELLDQEELPQKSSSDLTNTKQLKNSEMKNQKQLKNSDTKNQKQLKISENKNQKQLKSSENKNQPKTSLHKNLNQKKNTNQHNSPKDQTKDLIKSHSFSVSKQTNSVEEKTSKQKSQPNIPKPPSDAKKKNQNIIINNDKNIKSKAEKSESVPPLPRPKSMNNMIIQNEEDVDISSDDIGFALPSDDYEFSNSKSSYSDLSGLSDLDENELNQMFGDDEQVQMFADMLLPPDK